MRKRIGLAVLLSTALVGSSAQAAAPQTKNVLGKPYPPALEKPKVMDEMAEDYPSVWVDTHYNEKSVVVWCPKIKLTVRLAGAKKDDVLVVQHMEGKKKWGAPQKCMSQRGPWDADGTQLITFDCGPLSEIKSSNAGEFSAVLSYVQTATGKRHEAFDTLKYNVIKYRADTKPKNPDMKFVVDLDFRVNEAFIYPEIRPSSIHPELLQDPQEPLWAVIHLWLKWQKQEPNDPVMRCYYQGKEIAEAQGGSGGGFSYDSYKDAKSDSTTIGWSKYRFRFGKMAYENASDKEARAQWAKNIYVLKDHPGEYTCKVTYQGDVIRELAFTVKDNDVVRSACEANIVTFSPTALVKVTKTQGDAPFAKDAFKKNGFFGRFSWPANCP